MHLTYALGISENFDFEGFHNIILNILHMVLVDTPMLPPHEIPQLKLILRKVIMSIIPCGIHVRPSPEVLRG